MEFISASKIKFRLARVHTGSENCYNPPAYFSCQLNFADHINQDILDIAENFLYPIKIEKGKCTLMILDNLVEPQWILVDFDKPFLGDVLCRVKDDSSYLVEKSILNHFCPKYSVLINKTCYTFSWINTKMTLGRTCVTGKKIKEIDLKRFKVFI